MFSTLIEFLSNLSYVRVVSANFPVSSVVMKLEEALKILVVNWYRGLINPGQYCLHLGVCNAAKSECISNSLTAALLTVGNFVTAVSRRFVWDV